ncbi:MAG: sodium:proton antiporter [Microbacteriaceae bacterium]|nr:sodium:proton antiporter [Microbacteriaceae bacterium]
MVENGLVFGVVTIITIVIARVFSKRLGVASPLILILVGFGYSYIPGAPTMIPHEIVLVGLLPPILYAAAINVPVVDFRRNITTISALSVALVLVTAFGTGVILWLLFPDLSLAGGVALGAVISPTDAVAATALGKKLGLPPRLVTILEGESLVNDATALVLLRSAILAVSGAVTFWGVIGDFAFAVSVAVLVGLAVGFVTVWVRSRLSDPVLDTAISLTVPFIAFIPAEAIGASGVLAVVAAGLYSGHSSAGKFSAQSRISEKINWRTIQFVLENGVFLLMGVEISAIIADVHDQDLSVGRAVLYGLLMVVIVIVIRFLFIGPLILALRRQGELQVRRLRRVRVILDGLRHRPDQDEKAARRQERAERVFQRREGDVKQMRAEGLGLRGGAILGWSGMRGVVTLAAAQSLPEDGSVPYRSQLVLIAFTVAVVTLLVQGSTLPFVITLSGIRGSDRTADRRELAELLEEMGQAGVAALEDDKSEAARGFAVDGGVIDRVRRETLGAAESAWERAKFGTTDAGIAKSPNQQYRLLRREVLQAEREALLDARSSGSYPSRILARAQTMLDLEETRLEHLDNPSGS